MKRDIDLFQNSNKKGNGSMFDSKRLPNQSLQRTQLHRAAEAFRYTLRSYAINNPKKKS